MKRIDNHTFIWYDCGEPEHLWVEGIRCIKRGGIYSGLNDMSVRLRDVDVGSLYAALDSAVADHGEAIAHFRKIRRQLEEWETEKRRKENVGQLDDGNSKNV